MMAISIDMQNEFARKAVRNYFDKIINTLGELFLIQSFWHQRKHSTRGHETSPLKKYLMFNSCY